MDGESGVVETDLENGESDNPTTYREVTDRSEPGWMPGWSSEFGGGAWAESIETGEHLQIAVSTSGPFFHPTQQDNYPYPTSNEIEDSQRKEPDCREDKKIRESTQDIQQRGGYNQIVTFLKTQKNWAKVVYTHTHTHTHTDTRIR